VHLTKPGSKHYAALRCVECNTHIQWLSVNESNQLETLGVKLIKPWITGEELGI